ncbi:MAG: multi-sensor signal transduction histidine kinase [Puniceicoccaceae bacterium 5H]|nr:MAG: multi-sensor signal transduction histidine kinase [Puniceicoccaceae bacterium 5H]
MGKTRPLIDLFDQRSSLFRVLLLPLFVLLCIVCAATIYSLSTAMNLTMKDEVRRKSQMAFNRMADRWALRQYEGDFPIWSALALESEEFASWAIYDERQDQIRMAADPLLEGKSLETMGRLFQDWPIGKEQLSRLIVESSGRYLVTRPLPGDPQLHMIVLFDGRELREGFDRALQRSILTSLATLLMFGLLGFLLLRYRVLVPLQRVHDAIVGFHMGNQSVEAEVQARDEIGRISHGLNQLFHNQLAIQEESQQLAQVAQVTTNVVIVVDTIGRITWGNRALERLLGKPLKYFHLSLVNHELPTLEGSAWPDIPALARRHLGVTSEVTLVAPAGDELVFRVDSQPVMGEDGRFRGAVIVATDVTPLRRTQARLEQSEIRYNELVNAIEEVFFQTDREGRFVYLNQAWESVSGYRIADSMGERIDDFFLAHDREELDLRRQRVRDFEAARAMFELRLVRSDGHERVLELQLRGQRDPAGHFIGLAGKMRDVTLEREATDQLRRSRQRLARVLEGSNDGFWDYNTETGEVIVSPGYYRMLGYEPTEIEPTLEGWKDLLHPDDADGIMEKLHRAIRERTGYQSENRMRHKSGRYIWVLDRGRVIEERDGEPLIVAGSITNINERVEVEQRTRLALEREQQLNEMKSRIVSMISHEYRTPLSSIRLSATLLQRYAGKLSDEERTKHLGFIFEAVDQMTTLIEEVLYLGRAEAGYMEINLQPHRVRKVSNDLADWFLYLYPRRQLNLRLSGDVDHLVMLDLNLFKRVATNLLTNAVKYSAADTVVTFEVAVLEGQLILSVTDEGIGIPVEDQKHLFETFHRASNVGTIPGTGLGLVIIRRVVEKLGGQIHFSSQENHGTTFTIQLPALEAVEAEVPPKNSPARESHE